MTFGQYLRHIRGELAQRRFAQYLRCSNQYVNDLERDRRMPSNQMLARIADVAQVPLDVLYYYAGRIPPDLGGCDDVEHATAVMSMLREELK